MSNAQEVLMEVIHLASGPIEPRFLLTGSTLFPGENNRRANWRGMGASKDAFSSIIEAACEVMEVSGRGNNTMKTLHDAQLNGYFSFEGSVHTFAPNNEEEANKGEQGRVRERTVKPVSIVVRRLPFLEDYDIFRLV